MALDPCSDWQQNNTLCSSHSLEGYEPVALGIAEGKPDSDFGMTSEVGSDQED